jgi:hypothetical protein
MDDKTRQELEEAHKKAMEGIKAFNKSMDEGIKTINDYLGYSKDK